MKRYLAIILAAGMLLTGCKSETEVTKETSNQTSAETERISEPIKIRVAHHAGLSGAIVSGIDSIPENHFFQDEGLEVEWVKFTSGPPEVAAMISGDIQFGFLGHGAHTLAAEGKIDVISLHCLGNSEKIYVRRDSGIETVKDLEGKIIATQLGTSGEVLLNMALEKEGMSRDDLKIMNMDMSGAVAAFVAGQVDAIACWDVYASNVVEQIGIDNVTLLTSTGDFADQSAFPSSWVVTPSYADKNPDVVIRFLRALHRCYDYREENYDKAIQATADFLDTDYATLSKTKDDANNFNTGELKTMLEDGTIVDIYQRQLDYFLKEGKVSSGNVEEYVRVDLMERAFDTTED